MASEEFTGTKNIKLVAGSLYGLRAFFLNFDGTLSSPYYSEFQWMPGENEAECPWDYCHDSGEAIGSIECSCGFYSYHRPELAQTYYYGPETGVVGAIEAYGHVTIGDNGMRSSKARVVGVVAPRTRFRKKLRLAKHQPLVQNYPEIQTFQTLEQAAKAFNINGRPKILA